MKTLLHSKTAASLQALTKSPSGSVIFHGPRGIGKATAAAELARVLDVGSYPDLITVDRGEKQGIAIEQIRTLIGTLALRPYYAGRTRLVIIDEAHLLTHEAQNALLKLLEEPPPHTLIILI